MPDPESRPQNHPGSVPSTGIPNVELPAATVDLDRQSRCGFGEVIYAEGKPVELIEQIARTQLAAGTPVLATRIDPAAGDALAAKMEGATHHSLARTLTVLPPDHAEFDPVPTPHQPHVAVITAGSTDAPVAAEATQTLRWMRIPHTNFTDIGVAGPSRLQNKIDTIRRASVVVVIAGMEGALPSVVAGHVAVPVIAVPTSVGYGANLAGITPLLSALASCSAGVLAVGIDAGFKGGYTAGLIVAQLQRTLVSRL